MAKALVLGLLALAGAARAGGAAGPAAYDLVVAGGRVMDPESGLDGVRDVGIVGGKIAAVSASPLAARVTIGARGRVVAPGFIDLHAHGQDAENDALRAQDGVTTALELEIGAADLDAFAAVRDGRALVNFGASVGHVPVRMAVLGDPPAFLPPSSAKAATHAAGEHERAAILDGIRAGLERGALAVGLGLQYTPAASRDEIIDVFREAARAGASVHVHLRYGGNREPLSSTAALQETLAAALVTGASLHVVHLPSTSLGSTRRHLAMIDGARARGLDVTTECYPYVAGMTDLASSVFDEGWRENLGIGYGDLLWAATGERLTEATFAERRKAGGMVAVFSIPEDAVRAALAHPAVIVASDGIMTGGRGHPRTAGTNARLLGHYARDEKALPLMEAIGKITLLPARRLERRAPAFRDKGRIRVGADADITVFDAARVRDRATWTAPATPPEGIDYVIVGGVPVVERGVVRRDVMPGRLVRAPVRGR